MELRGKKALVVGLGISGRAAVRFLAARGAEVWATDRAEASALSPEPADLTSLITRLTLGGHRDEDFVQADLIVVSPGVPLDIEPLGRARAAEVAVIGELGLAAGFVEAPLVAVTGTNGKR
ncbi:MAG: UDP-N-acetylmuramoyl-L-alanine--D-glutamate ligase, partial [Proteobacteria bacterium]|nr:UDP-N-acetylmuramoyl-L-alanine--D-glutamate ligase [Pseudomonadota bacterium]